MQKQLTKTDNNHWPQRPSEFPQLMTPVVLPDGNGGFMPCPELMTEEELIQFLRIPEVSESDDHHNVIEHLKRVRNLPRIHICNKTLYPRKAIEKWIERETINEK
jgi:hypothetical protein